MNDLITRDERKRGVRWIARKDGTTVAKGWALDGELTISFGELDDEQLAEVRARLGCDARRPAAGPEEDPIENQSSDEGDVGS